MEFGKLSYLSDVKKNPFYHNGTKRKSWEELSQIAKDSWNYLPLMVPERYPCSLKDISPFVPSVHVLAEYSGKRYHLKAFKKLFDAHEYMNSVKYHPIFKENIECFIQDKKDSTIINGDINDLRKLFTDRSIKCIDK